MSLPLVFFSVLSQMAVGMACVLWLTTLLPAWKNESKPSPGNWLVVFMVSVAALAARVCSQTSPMEAWNALHEVGINWLSSEVQGFVLFTLFVFLLVRPTTKNFAIGATLVGVATLLIAAWDVPLPPAPTPGDVEGATLQPLPPELKDILISLIYLTTAVALGIAHCLRLLSRTAQTPLKLALAIALLLGFILHTGVPPVLVGLHLTPPFSTPSTPPFWVGLILAYVLPLTLLAMHALRKMPLPSIFPWLLLFGATLCRAQLFLF